MGVHSVQLGANSLITTTGVTLYTVPSGKRTILKSLIIENLHTATQRVIVTVKNGGTTKVQWVIWPAAGSSNGETVVQTLWVVLNVGDDIEIKPALGNVEAIASGAELDL